LKAWTPSLVETSGEPTITSPGNHTDSLRNTLRSSPAGSICQHRYPTISPALIPASSMGPRGGGVGTVAQPVNGADAMGPVVKRRVVPAPPPLGVGLAPRLFFSRAFRYRPYVCSIKNVPILRTNRHFGSCLRLSTRSTRSTCRSTKSSNPPSVCARISDSGKDHASAIHRRTHHLGRCIINHTVGGSTE
jgi:hypothetical protein